jgi:molybdate transport system substrate-binding protein
MTNTRKVIAIGLAAILAACTGEETPETAEAPAPAGPATIRVLTVGGTRIAMEALQAQYEASSGNTLEISFNNPLLIEELMVDEDFDVIIAANNSVNVARDANLLEPDTQRKLSRTGIGLSVREGTDPPDISTPEAFRETLLNADSIALTDSSNPNGSGIGTEKILGYAGIYDEVMAKATVQGLGDGKSLIAEGERDLGLFNVSEATAPGVVYVGPVPAVWQLYTNYDVAIFADSNVKEAAADLIQFLASDEAEANWNAGGIDLIAE